MNLSESLEYSHSKAQEEEPFPKRPPSSIFFFPDSEIQGSERQIIHSSQERMEQTINQPEVQDNPLILKFLIMKRLLTRFRDNLKTQAYIMSKLFTPQKVHMFEELISDKSTVFEDEQQSFASVFETSSYLLMVWDMSVILFSIFSLWMISFTLNFDIWEFKGSKMMFYFVIIITTCDALVMNNRAIISEGEVIRNRRSIFFSYLHLYLPQETLYIIIWILYHMKVFNTTQGIPELIVIIQIYLLIRKINQKYSAYYEIIFASGNNGSTDLFILVISIYIFNHLMACLWIYVALNSTDLGDTWILDRNLTDPWPIYNTAFYWASMTMTTVGYGDVVPKNSRELTAASAIMFISTCVFAYSMNSFGILLKNINDSKQEYKRNLVLMSTFMKNKEVQQGIQSRVRNYLKCLNDSKSQNLEEITAIITTLPINLKSELSQNIKMKAMAQITQIVTNFSLSTQTMLSEKLEQIDYSSGEIIHKSEDHDDLSLYYIIRGGVQLREAHSNKLVQSLKQGDHFGQYAFYTGFQPKYNIICSDSCSIYKIDRQNFINIIKHNQNDFQKFHCIKDRLIFNSEFSLIELNCTICTRATHETINCPWVSYKPDLESRVKKEYFINQERRKIKRQTSRMRVLTNFKKFNQEGNQFVLIHNQSVDLDHQSSIQEIVTKNTLEYIQTHSLNQQSSDNLHQPTVKEPALTRDTVMFLQVIDSTQNKIKSQVLETQNQQELEQNILDLQFHYCFIDQLCSYSIYMPNNNIEAVLTSMNRKLKSKYQLSNRYCFQAFKKPGQPINNQLSPIEGSYQEIGDSLVGNDINILQKAKILINMKSKQQGPRSFLSILSTEIAKVSEFKTIKGSKAFVLLQIYFLSMIAYSVRITSNREPYSYFQSFISMTTVFPLDLEVPICIIITFVYAILLGSLLSLAYESFKTQNRVTISDLSKKKLRNNISLLTESLLWISNPIVNHIQQQISVNIQLIADYPSAWRILPICNILFQLCLILTYIYFYRSYRFNQRGLYRIFNPIEYLKFLLSFVIIVLDKFSEKTISPFLSLLQSVILLQDMIWRMPFGFGFENRVFAVGNAILFSYSVLGVLAVLTDSINEKNIVETGLLMIPIILTLTKQIQWLYWQSLLQYTRVSGVRNLQIKRLCQALEALIWYIEDGRDDQLKCMLSIQMLKWHEVNCVDLNCDCREVKETQNRDQRDSMTHRSSFHSKTAIMSDGGKNSQPGQTINDLSGTKTLKDGSVLQEKVQQTKRETEAMDIDKFMIFLAKRVNQISQPMHFIKKQQVDEDLISKFIKRQFTQTIQQLSFTTELDQVEFLSLKYISFMYTFKQNSPQSLAKLRQIQSRNVNFSFFFNHICKVTESFLIDSILLSHDKNDLEDVSMDVAEVWRLELIKDTIVNSIVAVLKKKIDLWDRLQSGEISSMDRMLLSVIQISKQVEQSISLVDSVLDDFTITVQKTYSYYLKYQCFKALFFLSDYRQAVKYQRLMEDSWALSKQSGKAGVIGNYEWLTGDMVTVEVSVGVQTGQIVKGVNQRLVDFLNFPTMEEMESVLRIRGIPAQQSSHTQNLYVAALMPPFLTASHNYFIQKFIQRGHTHYSGTPILSFLSDSAGFIFPVNVYLSFNFTNLHDFTLLGSIVKNKDENDYLIFDEWGRILGVGQKTFDKLIMKGALDEFGLIQFQYINHVKKNRNNKANLINKIAHDDNAKLFKKTITMHQTLKSGKSGTKRESRRTYQKPSEILLQFGSIQHFLPQIGKSLTDLISREIFKKLQKESQQQFNKLIDQDERQQLEKQASNIFQKQVSMMVDRQQSMAGTAALQSNLLDKQQYRNFIMSNYLQSNGLMKKDVQLLQDEKLVLYVPKNYNELIEYFNDAGDRFMDNRGEFDNKSVRRQQMLSRRGDTLKQQQNCYHLFDADFQDFIDNKVRKYYSKSLLKEAISAKESKYLDMVRYKSVVNIEVGLGGVNDQDQFLYFVCKLSNLNLMTAKRKDVIKMHLKKDQRQQFEGGDDLRRSLLQIQSNDSIIDRAQSSRENTLELKDSGKAKFPFYQAPEKRTEFQQNAVVSLQIPNSRTYVNHEREEGPNMKVEMVPTSQKLNESSFDMDISMESQLINKKDPMISSDSIKYAEKQRSLDMKQSFGKSLGVPKFQKQHSIEVKEQKQFASDPNSEPRIDDEPQIGDDPPKPKKRFKFLEKMEKAFLENKRKNSLVHQGAPPDITQILADPRERKSSLSLLSPGNSGANIFGIMFSRLNLRRVSNVDINKNDQFEINDQGGFREESEGTEKAISASASNSMSSNNISRDDAVNDDEDLVNKNDELVNIFEVMSQASNHQSIKSISAIAMATNISQRCFNYQPKQAQSLQIFKLLLIALNIAAIVSLITTTQTYFNSITTDQISLSVANQYKASSQVLLLSNQIFQPNIMTFPYTLNQTLFLKLINTSYLLLANISREYYQYVPNLQSAIQSGLTAPSLLTIPQKYTMNQLSDFLTQSRIELDYINSINVYANNLTLQSITAQQITFNQSLDYLTNRLIFNQIYAVGIINKLQSQSSQSMTNNSLVIVILMSSFAGLHLVVILFIVPYIKQINDIYFRVLQIVSRVTQEEAIDEIKKLTLCQHLLQTKDDQWVTQNQVKLVFYNRSKDLELTQKLRRRQEKGKDSSYFQFKLSDTNLSIWRDMVLYLMISSISIGYLIFAIVLIQTQVNSFTSYLNQYNGAVLQSISLSALMSKLSISPERYIQINNQSIPTQYTLYSYQQSNQLSYILSSITSDTQSLQSFQTILSTFVEQLNLDYSFTVDPNKITFNTQNWTSQPVISSNLEKINHLLKDNLCYYSEIAICSFTSQIPYFNTGFLGALQLINQFVINYNSLLTGFNTITFGTSTTPNTIINYITNQDYQMLVAYGNSVLNPVFDQLLTLLSSQLDDKRQSKFSLVLSLFIGIGIPIMILTLILALIEMQILNRKVKRIMMSITYIPTYKFQEKIMLSLVKAVLQL